MLSTLAKILYSIYSKLLYVDRHQYIAYCEISCELNRFFEHPKIECILAAVPVGTISCIA